MSAAWPVWNNDNPLPGPPPRAWVPVVIQNTGHPVPVVSAPGSSFLDAATPRPPSRWAVGPLASVLVHVGALAAGILLFLPVDDDLAIQGSAVEVEIISMQTVASNEVSDVLSDVTESMVSAGSEVVEATEPETLDPVEPEQTVTPETAEPVAPDAPEALRPDTVEATEPTTAEPVEVTEPVEAVVAETMPLLASTQSTAEPLEAIEPDAPEAIDPVETAAVTQPKETAEPVEPAEVVEASEPVDPNAPPVPQTRTVAQRQEPTFPEAEARKDPPTKPKTETTEKPKPQKPKPSTGGNGGNSNADAKAGAPPAGQTGTGVQGNSAAVTKYPGQVLSKLRRALRYPSGGRGTGEVQVQFTVSAGGTATAIRVVSSSGNPVFDNAAIETVRRASPFAAIPADAGRDSWTFTMPLGFVR